MKKLLIASALFLFVLLGILYLAVNSPYVVDKIARKYAPQYGFGYARILGNPLKGIILEDLSYRGQKLARKIRIRLNPYTLFQKKLTVSKLSLLDVKVPVLERVIRDFTASASAEDASGTGEENSLPLAIEAQNIQLTLLPFSRYGVEVRKEELSVDSIYYDGGIFNVGRLHQVAETSLGTVELEGTYHKRFLDVQLLAIDDLELAQLQKLIKTLQTLGAKEGGTSDALAKEKAQKPQESAPNDQEDIFLPLKIHAEHLWLTMRPYELKNVARVDWAQVEGKGVFIDLERYRILKGMVTADLQSDLGNARIRASFKEGNATLEEGVLDRVDLAKILALGDNKNAKSVSRAQEKNPAASQALDTLPFVPPGLTIGQLRIELSPGAYEGVKYRNPILSVKNLHADLHSRRIVAENIAANLDTPLAHLNLETAIDGKMIRIRRLDLDEVNLTAIGKLASTFKNKTRPRPAKPEPSAGKRGITLEYLPSQILLDRGEIRLEPTQISSWHLQNAKADLKGVRFDLSKMLASEGRLAVELQSDLAAGRFTGRIRDNLLKLEPSGANELRLHKRLFESYGLPLRAEAFSPIKVGGTVGRKDLNLSLAFDARKILKDQNASFNLEINRSVTRVRYSFDDGNLSLKSKSRLSTAQAPEMLLNATLSGRGDALRYRGSLDVGTLKLGNEKLERMLAKPRLDFAGDLHALNASLDAGLLKGRFVSRDLKKGLLELTSKEPVKLAEYFKLPKKLAAAKGTFRIVAPIDLAKPLPLDANVSLSSNLADIGGRVRYDGNLSTELTSTFPKNSLLAKLDPRLKITALNPLKLALKQRGEDWRLGIKSKVLGAQIDYNPSDDALRGDLRIAGTDIKLSGRLNETITAQASSPSVKRLLSGIRQIYAVEIPRLDGDVSLRLKIQKLSKATLELHSKKFVPDADARIKSPITNIFVQLEGDLRRQTLELKKYRMESAGMKLFADKPSILVLQKGRLVLRELWVNDSLKIQGYYDLKKAKGEFQAKASRFKLVHQNADLEAAIDIAAKIAGEKIDAKGKIILLGGRVMYDIQAKHYATDEDIIILQHLKKKKESFFRKNVQLSLYIETQKPLLFKQKNAYVQLRPQLSVIKGFDGDLQVMGSIPLAKGGYYIFEGKRFTLQPSSINFTGKATRPLLDIHLIYRRYSRTVYISVSGVATEPSLNFSSDPYMTRDQILSFILFDTVDSGESAGEMLTMVGGGIAKSILGNLGLKVDTLILTSNGFEIGKKITDKITILYDQKSEEPKVIVRIQHSKRTETDISIGSQSQSVDIIYKREF